MNRVSDDNSARLRKQRPASTRIALVSLFIPLVSVVALPVDSSPAYALSADDCIPSVTVANGTLDDGSDGQPDEVGDKTEYVERSVVGGECVLKFVKADVTMTWDSSAVDAAWALVLGGGGGGGRAGGGAGGWYDTTSTSRLSMAAWDDAEIRIGSGGVGASSRAGGSSGNQSFLRRQGSTLGSTGETDDGILVSGGDGGDGGSGSATSNTPHGGANGFDGGTVSTASDSCFNSKYTASGDGGDGAGQNGGAKTLNCPDSGGVSGGDGGDGRTSSITGSGAEYFYGGGGAGGAYTFGGTFTVSQGARDARYGGGSVHNSGSANTGGGGGGREFDNKAAGGGGSGVVIVRFALPSVGDDPTFGAVSTTATGFEFQIGNYYSQVSDGSGVAVDWAASGTNSVTASVDSSGLVEVVFPSDDRAALASGSTLSSTITVTATAASGLYSSASATQSGTSRKGQADLSITASGTLPFGGSVELTASGGSGSGAFGDFVVDSGECSVSGSTLSTTAAARTVADGGGPCVVSVTKAGDSEFLGKTIADGDRLSINVSAGAPAVVENLSAVLVGTSGATLSWDVPDYDGGQSIASYAVTPDSLSCEFNNPTDTTCDITGLARGVTSSITVAAVNSVGNGPTSTVTVTTPALPSSSGGGDDEEETVSPVPSATPAPAVGPGGTPGRPGPGVPPRAPGAGTNGGPGVAPPVPGGVTGAPVPPDRPGGSVGGVPVPTTTSASPGGRGVSVSAGGVDVGVDVPDPGNGAGGVVDRGGTPEPVVTPGQGKTIAGGGAAPGSVVEVWLPGAGGSTRVAEIPVGSDGSFSADVNVFGEDPLPIGRNVVQMVTTNTEGDQVLVDMPFTIAQGTPVPEVRRDTGNTPNAPVEGALVTTAGVPDMTPRVSSDETSNTIAVDGESWAVSVAVSDRASVSGEGQTTEIRSAVGEEVTVAGSGFMPDTRVDVWAFSTPVLLGSATVDAEGSVLVAVQFDPATVPVGQHTVQVQAVGMDGFIRATNLPVTVEESMAVATSEQAGTLLWWIIGLTAALLLIALISALIIRRRQA